MPRAGITHSVFHPQALAISVHHSRPLCRVLSKRAVFTLQMHEQMISRRKRASPPGRGLQEERSTVEEEQDIKTREGRMNGWMTHASLYGYKPCMWYQRCQKWHFFNVKIENATFLSFCSISRCLTDTEPSHAYVHACSVKCALAASR